MRRKSSRPLSDNIRRGAESRCRPRTELKDKLSLPVPALPRLTRARARRRQRRRLGRAGDERARFGGLKLSFRYVRVRVRARRSLESGVGIRSNLDGIAPERPAAHHENREDLERPG